MGMIRKYWKRVLLWGVVFLVLVCVVCVLLARKVVPAHITYGMSFNTPYVLELGLDPKVVYTAVLDDLGVRHLRLAAHWPLVEPHSGVFDFSVLDYQVAEAQKRGADIILALGRRLPRWPECHVPAWAQKLAWEEQKTAIRAYLTTVVNRYKSKPNIIYWQVENEPYLSLFAHDQCGDLDEEFLKEEIALVHSLDSTRPVLVTDSGNLGTWGDAFGAGDAFGTSVYVYFWNPTLGQFRTILPSVFYRMKENVMKLLHGEKPTFLIELSLEPWLIETVRQVPIEVQLSRMDTTKFDEIVEYAKATRYAQQYLWGGEWWFWMKAQGHAEFWEKGKALFRK